MIARLRGEVVARDVGSVVLDVQGVGYLVHVAGATAVPAIGRTFELHTSLQVREDSMTLYGFGAVEELRLFELLLTSSGVGPRLASAALASLRVEVLEAAIADGDIATLISVPGIGRKVAERLVLELRDKVQAPPPGPDGSGSPGLSEVLDEVRAALAAFGFSAGESSVALRSLDLTGEESSAEVLRRALRGLGRGVEAVR
jgi:holliday junction DNA helicase RuvA